MRGNEGIDGTIMGNGMRLPRVSRVKRSNISSTSNAHPCCRITMLCIFSDSSTKAFGNYLHVRWLSRNGRYESKFITATSRVVPLVVDHPTSRATSCRKECRLQFKRSFTSQIYQNRFGMDRQSSKSLHSFRFSSGWGNSKQI